jgi:cytochrome c556
VVFSAWVRADDRLRESTEMGQSMRKSVGVAVVVALAAVACGAIIAEAQTGAAQAVTARKDLMRSQGRAVASLQPMLRNEQPWNQQTAVAAMTTLQQTSQQIPSVFPEGSGAGPGIETRALPAIWQNRQAFEATAASLNTAATQLLQLAQANQEAAFRAAFPAVGQACGACHTTFRAPQ